MILILGGTSDGNALADRLASRGLDFKLSVTSEYGVEMAKRHSESLMMGRLTRETLTAFVTQAHIDVIIDATHPHAAEISTMAQQVSKQMNCFYVRYERPGIFLKNDADMTVATTVEEASALANQKGRRILITGSKHLKEYTTHLADADVFVRIIPSPEVIKDALECGIAADHIIAMKGPFTEKLNSALYEALKIQVLITKESGDTGGFSEKINAARACGVHTVVIQRPQITYENCLQDLEAVESAVLAFIKENSHEKSKINGGYSHSPVGGHS